MEKIKWIPPTMEEVGKALGKTIFGNKYWEKMMANAPWSFLLIKMMWKEGEEPWEEKSQS